jgi:hypothetical protein
MGKILNSLRELGVPTKETRFSGIDSEGRDVYGKCAKNKTRYSWHDGITPQGYCFTNTGESKNIADIADINSIENNFGIKDVDLYVERSYKKLGTIGMDAVLLLIPFPGPHHVKIVKDIADFFV